MEYTIQMVAKLSGVGVHTIRAWEKRYKAIVPARDLAGHRIYSKTDLEKLILLNKASQLGFGISKIAGLKASELIKKLEEFGVESGTEVAEPLKNEKNQFVEVQQSVTIILMALKAYKLDIVSKELFKLKLFLNARDFAMSVVLPMMSELGKAVDKGEYNVSHEHALTAILKFHMGNYIYYSESKKMDNRQIDYLVAGIEGDYHEFGVMIATMLCRHYNKSAYYLGPNMPIDSMVDAAKALNVPRIIIGATSVDLNFGVKFTETYIEKLFKGLDETVEIYLGGNVQISAAKAYQKRFQYIKTIEDFEKIIQL